MIHIRLNMRKMNLKNVYYETDGWHHNWLNCYLLPWILPASSILLHKFLPLMIHLFFSTITVFVSHVGTLRMLVWKENTIMAT